MFGWGQRYVDRPVAPVIHTIAIATSVIFVLQLLVTAPAHATINRVFALSREGVLQQGWIWQFVTYLFLHGGFLHVLFNMLVLVSFGRELEARLGSWRVALLYLMSGTVGGLGWLLLSGEGGARCIGASGAVYGVAAAFAALDPDREMTFVIFPIPIPITMTARRMVIAFGVVSLVFLILASGNIAHAAHLAGGVGGYLYGLRAKRQVWLGVGAAAEPPWRRWRLPRRAPQPDAAEVDRILEKVHARGLDSLSRRERDVLERAGRSRP